MTKILSPGAACYTGNPFRASGDRAGRESLCPDRGGGGVPSKDFEAVGAVLLLWLREAFPYPFLWRSPGDGRRLFNGLRLSAGADGPHGSVGAVGAQGFCDRGQRTASGPLPAARTGRGRSMRRPGCCSRSITTRQWRTRRPGSPCPTSTAPGRNTDTALRIKGSGLISMTGCSFMRRRRNP